jgi:hypothetical protein
MKKQVVIGTFGDEGKLETSSYGDANITLFPLVTGNGSLGMGISDAIHDLSLLNIFPTEIGLELLFLAAHVYAADTRISRAIESQDAWTREIRLVVPVNDIAKWNATKVRISKLLNFLTGDIWELEFRQRSKKYSQILASRPKTKVVPEFDIVSLFSGGLDSLIGTINLLTSGRKPLLISHAGDGATSGAQTKCFDYLKKVFNKSPFGRLRFWLNIREEVFGGNATENTTRGRSFLFFALGAFSGSGMGKPSILQASENGLIALNVPLDPLRLGALSTRTTHPYYMEGWNELLKSLDIPCVIENPYLFQTKGEMIQTCSDIGLLNGILGESMSCSSPAKARWRKGSKGIEHCGYCLPCLIRRASINASIGSKNDPTSYTIADLNRTTLNTNKAEGQQVRSFQLAIKRIKDKPALINLLIHKPGPLPQDRTTLSKLARVYQNGMLEVDKLISAVKTKPL